MAILHQLKKEPDPDVVLFLERVLERARSGETSGVLILEQDAKGLRYALAGIKERFTVLGWLSHAMHRLQTDEE